MATGAPNPAHPSMKAPKENAITRACTRRSPESRATERLTTSKVPDLTLRL